MNLSDVAKFVKPLANRISNMVSRATVSQVDSSKKMQLLQIGLLTDETRDAVEHFQPMGFASVPEADSEAVVVFVGGRRDHGLAVVVDDRSTRITDLAPGEVALYHKSGSRITLKANGDIEIDAAANVVLNGGSTAVAKVGSSLIAGPFGGTVTSGSSTVLVP